MKRDGLLLHQNKQERIFWFKLEKLHMPLLHGNMVLFSCMIGLCADAV